MKLVGKHINKDHSGYVSIRPEDDEDMWHLYNLIQEGDNVRAPAIRRVQNVSATGSSESHRVRTTLTLTVSRVEFSPSTAPTGAEASSSSTTPLEPTASLQVTGRVAAENSHVKLGAFHTLDIEANRDVRIEKLEWDSIALERIEEASIPGRGAEVGAIVCGEGTAAFCLLSQHMTVVRQRIAVPVPRKRTGSATAHERGLSRFYDTLYQTFLRHIPYSSPSLRAIVIASPGWVRDAVFDHIMAEATRTGNRALLGARPKFVRVHINSPHVHSLVEVLKSPEIVSQLKETKFAREGIMLDKFFKMLGSDEQRAWYGPDHVSLAVDRGAVGTLLISDELFRASDPQLRKRYVTLVEDVREKRGEVLIFSSMHESGQQLNQITGIAAILNFPLDVEVVEAEEREAKEEAEKKLQESAEGA
ncbi:pelota [Auriscalpium vulgare]|uniref:Pelota n=1 Tax=Auriscalpium vulgare TaxID=40419 RepID=A0ACB8SAR1_9AGAM|nr:pelota [Auriscalpium vulgare]